MCQGEFVAGQCFRKSNSVAAHQIIATALEDLVLLLQLQYDHNIASQHARSLVRLAGETNLGTGLHTTKNLDLENLLMRLGLLTVALGAAVLGIDDLTLAIAVRAVHLHLLHDASTDLTQTNDNSLAVAAAAMLGRAGSLGAASLAASAQDRLGHAQLARLAVVEIGQSNVERVHLILALARTAGSLAASPATEETVTEETAKHILS
mmetsp:Transcript_40633/g.102288  ORF Transcript_40633/g.102288 Transcript_40633/m.102288 type:complete len:207 (+) Transcript_40633:405-1025(+)